MYTLFQRLSQNQDSTNPQKSDGFDFQTPTPITAHVHAKINVHKWVFLLQKAAITADKCYKVYKWSIKTFLWFQLPILKKRVHVLDPCILQKSVKE